MGVCNGTTVIYNGVAINDVLTDEVSQDVLWDKTDVDPIGVRVSVSVTGYVHMSSNENFGVRGSGGLAVFMQNVQQALLMQRRSFEMRIGDQLWMVCAPYGVERCSSAPSGVTGAPSHSGFWDIENGPRTQLRIIGIVGQHAIKIRFQIKFCVPMCSSPTAAYDFKGLMHLRYWMTDAVDCTNWTVTRTTQGRMRFYGAIPVVNGVPTHQLILARYFAIPPLQWGFARKRIDLIEDPSGLEAEFKITDQEMHAVAPAPATDWEGHFEVTMPYGGVSCESECRVTVRGGPATPKWHLLRLASTILDAKLNLTNQANGNYIPMVTTFSEPLHLNEVTGFARIKNMGQDNFSTPLFLNVFQCNRDTWFKPFPPTGPGSLNLAGIAPAAFQQYHPGHGFQGSSPDGQGIVTFTPNSVAGLLHAALQTPCCPIWLSNNVSGYMPQPSSGGGTDDTQEGTNTEIGYVSQSLGAYTNTDSDAQREHLYWNARLTSEYRVSNGLAAFPRAQADSDGNTLSIVRMHAPTWFREVRFEYTRVAEWPQMPKPKEQWTDSQGIVHTLVDFKLAPNASGVGADGKTDVRSVAAVLLYAMSRPPDWEDAGEKIAVGRLPNRDAKGNLDFQQIDPAKSFVEPETMIDAKV